MINEAIGIYSEGIASVADIDTAMKHRANHPIGPLPLEDLVVLAILEILYKETSDNKNCLAPLHRKMVRGMKLGRKTGEG